MVAGRVAGAIRRITYLFNKKSAVGVGVVAALGLGLGVSAGVASATSAKTKASKASKAIKVAYFVSQLGNPFTESDINGAKAAAKAMGSSVTVFNGNTNPQTQLSQCQTAVSGGQYQAFEISPIVGTVLKTCVAQAKAKHIKVVAIDGPLGVSESTLKPQMPGVTGSVFLDNQLQGEILGQLVIQACAKKSSCQVAVMIGDSTFASNTEIDNMLKSGVASHHNIQIVATAAGDYTEAGGQSAAQDLLAAHPNLNVLATFADQMAMGAQKVLASKGDLKKIVLTGDGGSTNAMTAICAGDWVGTVDANPYITGYDGAKLAIEQARGQNPPSEIDPMPNVLNKSNCGKTSSLHLFTIAG